MALPLSQDLRARIVHAVSEGSSIRQAAARFDVSPSSAIKLMQRFRATGSTVPAKIGGYRRPLLDGQEVLLQDLTAAKPGITLVEIKAALAERGIEGGHISTIWSTLRRLGLSHKKSR
jgi:putative transposase